MTADRSLDVHTSVGTLPDAQWNDVVARSPLGSVFHRTEWLRAVERGIDVTPRHVTVSRDGTLVGLLPNVLSDVDLPIGLPGPASGLAPRELVSVEPGFGGPIVTGDHEQVLDRLLEGVRTAATGDVWAHRMRAVAPAASQYADHLDGRGYDVSTLTCQLVADLTGSPESVFERWDKERRRTARKAREAGMTVQDVEPDPATLDAFYDAYAAMIDRVDGVRFPRSFFAALAECLGERLVLFRADLDGEAVGWHLYLRDDEGDSLHHFFSGLRAEHFGLHPSSRLHEHGVEWASEEGYATYNFGESVADVTDGGFRYKAQYGGTVEPVLTWERGLAPVRWGAFRVARRLYRTYRARTGDVSAASRAERADSQPRTRRR